MDVLSLELITGLILGIWIWNMIELHQMRKDIDLVIGCRAAESELRDFRHMYHKCIASNVNLADDAKILRGKLLATEKQLIDLMEKHPEQEQKPELVSAEDIWGPQLLSKEEELKTIPLKGPYQLPKEEEE